MKYRMPAPPAAPRIVGRRPGARSQRGQNLVEFAYVLPLLLLITILLITIPGFLAWDTLLASNIADQAAQDGATAASTASFSSENAVACQQTAIPEATQRMQQSAFSIQGLSVTCTSKDVDPGVPASYSGGEQIRRITVTISFSVRLLLPGAVAIPVTVTGWARIERVIGP